MAPRHREARIRRPGSRDKLQTLASGIHQQRVPIPIKYGYTIVDRVECGPTELQDRIVSMPHPHLDIFTLPAQAVVPTLDDLPPTRAALVANMEPAHNAAWDAAPAAVDNIAVVGAGVVGSPVAWLFGRLPGICVTLIDIEPSRADLALVPAVEFAAPGIAPEDCDLVVHASGTASGLATVLGLAAKEATVLELSWYGASELAVPLGGASCRRHRAFQSRGPCHRRRRGPRGTSRGPLCERRHFRACLAIRSLRNGVCRGDRAWRALVGTTAGAIPETAPASAGMLAPPEDIGAFSAAVRQLIEDSAERHRLAAAARAAAVTLPTWEQSAEAFSRTIEVAV
jgi:hypothetical protein